MGRRRLTEAFRGDMEKGGFFMIQLTTPQEMALDRARERFEKIRAEELDVDRARMLAMFQVVRLLDALGLRDVADAVEEFV